MVLRIPPIHRDVRGVTSGKEAATTGFTEQQLSVKQITPS